MATTAAPTYLPAMHLDGIRLVDGGIWANNPCMVDMTEAAGPLGIPLSAIKVLSLGTTTELRHRHQRLGNGGLLPWATDAVELLMRSQSGSATKQLRHLLGRKNVLRIDPTVAPGLMTLDRIDAGYLIGRAGEASRQYSPDIAAAFTDHLAAPYTPFHPRKKA